MSSAAVILAAGLSRRLGQPKQLLELEGQPMVERMVAAAETAGLAPIIVVTGAYREDVHEALAEHEVVFVHNADYESGMGTSIAAGFGHLNEQSDRPPRTVLILSDQPAVDASLLRDLAHVSRASVHGLVACRYCATFGPPVVVPREMYAKWIALHGDHGAKHILVEDEKRLVTVNFPEGAIDIDTPEDLERLLESQKRRVFSGQG